MDDTTFVERCIVKAGGSNSKFVKCHGVLLTATAYVAPSLFVYAFSFFTLLPALKCPTAGGPPGSMSACTQKDYCAKNGIIDWEDSDSIVNFVTEIQPSIICDSSYHIKTSMFGTVMLAGFLIGSIFLTPLGDVHGRKKMNWILNLIQGIGIWGVTVVMAIPAITNYWALLFFTFVLGLGTAAHYNMAVIYTSEFTTWEHQKRYTFYACVGAATVMVILGIEYYFVKSILPGLYFNSAILLFNCFYYLWLPESPYFAYGRRQLDVFTDSIDKMAAWNGVTDLDVEKLLILRAKEVDLFKQEEIKALKESF